MADQDFEEQSRHLQLKSFEIIKLNESTVSINEHLTMNISYDNNNGENISKHDFKRGKSEQNEFVTNSLLNCCKKILKSKSNNISSTIKTINEISESVINSSNNNNNISVKNS
eukprot:199132_1